MAEIANSEKSGAPDPKKSSLTQVATAVGLASALGGIAAVFLPALPAVAVLAAAVGAAGGFFVQRIPHR